MAVQLILHLRQLVIVLITLVMEQVGLLASMFYTIISTNQHIIQAIINAEVQ